MSNNNPRKNAEGYNDPTAYQGIKNATANDDSAEHRLRVLIKTIKCIIGLCGFELLNRIELRDTQSGKTYR